MSSTRMICVSVRASSRCSWMSTQRSPSILCSTPVESATMVARCALFHYITRCSGACRFDLSSVHSVMPETLRSSCCTLGMRSTSLAFPEQSVLRIRIPDSHAHITVILQPPANLSAAQALALAWFDQAGHHTIEHSCSLCEARSCSTRGMLASECTQTDTPGMEQNCSHVVQQSRGCATAGKCNASEVCAWVVVSVSVLVCMLKLVIGMTGLWVCAGDRCT